MKGNPVRRQTDTDKGRPRDLYTQERHWGLDTGETHKELLQTITGAGKQDLRQTHTRSRDFKIKQEIQNSEWNNWIPGRVYYRALVHFVHLLWVLSAFTLSDPAELSALKVPGWRTRNGEKMKWKTMDTTRTKRAPSWLRSGKGGALSAAFHKKSTFILAGLVSRVSRADLRPSLPPSG